jgi:membrane-bound lytic murein transglycosylase MltF
MRVTWSLAPPATLAVMLLAAPLVAPGTCAQEKRLAATPRQLSLANKPWKGDFDAMLERRMIRVLIPYSRTRYFTDKGRERGITAENVRDFERYLNKKYAKPLGKRPLTIYIIPTTRDKLIPRLTDGLGDIAAGNLTVWARSTSSKPMPMRLRTT